MKYNVHFKGRDFEVQIEGEAPHYVVCVDGRPVQLNASTLGDASLLSVLMDNQSFLAHVVRTDAGRGLYEVSISGKFGRFEVLDELSAMAQHMQPAHAHERFVLQAPMPGLVVDVRVQEGDSVEIGTPLIIMEAMKMQNELVSEVTGTVTAVRTEVNQAVESGTEMIVIEAD